MKDLNGTDLLGLDDHEIAHKFCGQQIPFFTDDSTEEYAWGKIVGYWDHPLDSEETGIVVVRDDGVGVNPTHIPGISLLADLTLPIRIWVVRFKNINFEVLAERAVARKAAMKWPHICPRCNQPAFIMARTVECSNYYCPLFIPGAKGAAYDP